MAAQIADLLLQAAPSANSVFYDLCCGSAAVSIELVNRGIAPTRIRMLDISSWGVFWTAIGSGQFEMDVFEQHLSALPSDKRELKSHMTALAARPVEGNEAELYPLLQACSFGGKQIWRDGERWANAFFRDYWQPTPTSIRRSPANPMQPSPDELRRRIGTLVRGMKGVACVSADVMTFPNARLPRNAVVYVDPPYENTTGYGFGFNVNSFIARVRARSQVPLFISEGVPLSKNATRLTFGGAKGGISGVRQGRHQEWLSRI